MAAAGCNLSILHGRACKLTHSCGLCRALWAMMAVCTLSQMQTRCKQPCKALTCSKPHCWLAFIASGRGVLGLLPSLHEMFDEPDSDPWHGSSAHTCCSKASADMLLK